jgi:hypothetical protein
MPFRAGTVLPPNAACLPGIEDPVAADPEAVAQDEADASVQASP